MSWKDTVIDFLIRYGFQIVGAVIILGVGALVARWVGRLADGWMVRQNLELPIRTLVSRVVKLLVFALAVILALDKFGVQITPLIAGIGVAGAGIALAMQGMLSNFFAGLTIIFTKPFRVGEWIELLGVHGQVINVELFNTVLMHPDGSRVIIPNRKIIGEILHNYGATRQLDLAIAVPNNADVDRVLAAVTEALASNPRVHKEPAPVVGVGSVGIGVLNIAVKPWVSVADVIAASGEINKAVVERFREKNIPLPVPLQDIRLLNAPAQKLGGV